MKIDDRNPRRRNWAGFDGEEVFTFRLHEAGCRRLSKQWNFKGVRSPFWRLYWSQTYGPWIESSGRRFALGPKQLLFVPSHVLFDTHSSDRIFTHFWIHFSIHPDLVAKENIPFLLTCKKEFTAPIVALTKKIRRPTGSPLREIHHLCSALLHQIFANSSISSRPVNLPAKLPALLEKIEASLANPLPVGDLARQAAMSRGGFIRWFKDHLKISPARYVLKRRIDHACHQLKTSSDTIEEISERLGFASRGHFSRAFKRQMGSGPATFRKS